MQGRPSSMPPAGFPGVIRQPDAPLLLMFDGLQAAVQTMAAVSRSASVELEKLRAFLFPPPPVLRPVEFGYGCRGIFQSHEFRAVRPSETWRQPRPKQRKRKKE